MSYGTPAGAGDIEAYYTHIRRGRRPTEAQIQELKSRYAAIGGSSPLLQICRAQAESLQLILDADPSARFQVELGMKHSPPFIEEGVQRLIERGVRTAVGLVLAPHYSSLSIGEYISRASAAAGSRIELSFVSEWHLMPAYISLLASRVREAMRLLQSTRMQGHGGGANRRGEAIGRARGDDGEIAVVFTAHSLPRRILALEDPYPAQLLETAEAVAREAGLSSFTTAWQSAGRTGEQWLGPDIGEVIRSLSAGGCEGVIVCPAGFTADHLEVLYDLDVECARLAAQLSLMWRRTRSLNADPVLMAGLAKLVRDRVPAGVR